MWGRRLWYLAVLAGCLVFYFCYQKWVSWILLLCVLGLPWFSLLISLPGILSFYPWVRCPNRVDIGEEATVAMLGDSRFPVPPFRGKIRLTQTPSGWNRLHRSGETLDTGHCGCVIAGPERVYVMDYLGLFRFRVRKTTPRQILIFPQPMKMTQVPDLDQLLSRSWRPKPGGGFSENHELRPYRPGDGLNQIHWKLTAKVGQPIIREPMIPQRMRILVTMDLSGTPEELDRKLGRLLWLMNWLREKKAEHQILVMTGEGIRSFYVGLMTEPGKILEELLQTGGAGGESMLDYPLEAAWHCHVGGLPDEA